MKAKVMKKINSLKILVHQPFLFAPCHVLVLVIVQFYIPTDMVISSAPYYTQPLHFPCIFSTNYSDVGENSTF